jgi:hypothetical protein
VNSLFPKYCRQLGGLVQLRDTSDILKEEELKNVIYILDIIKTTFPDGQRSRDKRGHSERSVLRDFTKGLSKG